MDSPAIFQRRFFENAKNMGTILEVMEDIPGLSISIKDREGRFIFLSREMQRLLGVESPDELIGSTDLHHFPEAIAERLMKGDAEVINSGLPLRDVREPFFCPRKGFTWSITGRWPIRNYEGEIIGVLGKYRIGLSSGFPHHEMQPESPFRIAKHHEEIHRTTEFIIKNSHRTLTSDEIARNVGISIRQLNRILQDTHLLSLRNFATTIRIQLASKALAESDLPIIEIAHNFGFANQSSFTTQFKKFTGTTPRHFRMTARSGHFES